MACRLGLILNQPWAHQLITNHSAAEIHFGLDQYRPPLGSCAWSPLVCHVTEWQDRPDFLNSPRLIVLHCRTSSSSVYYPDFCPKSETNIQSVESWIGLYSNSEGLIHVHWLISNFWTFHHDPLVHSWGLRKDQAPKSLKWPAIILKAIKCIGLALGMMFSHYEFLSEVIGAVFSRPPYERDVIGCCRSQVNFMVRDSIAVNHRRFFFPRENKW